MSIYMAIFLYLLLGVIEWKWGPASQDLKRAIDEIEEEKSFALRCRVIERVWGPASRVFGY